MIVIANPAASGGGVGRDWAELSARVRAAFPDAKLLQTSGAGDGRRLAREAVESGASRVLSLGGDGTHNEVINGLLDASPDPEAVTFGALPAGTGGDFCRMYACDKTIDATLEHLRAGVTSPLDLGVVEGLDDDGEPLTRAFLNIASCGASGLVDRFVNASSKRLGGKASFFIASLRATWAYTPATVKLRLDGHDIGTYAINSVLACNGRWAGGGMFFAPDASLSDGVLEIVVIEDVTPSRILPLATRIYRGEHASLPFVHTFRGRTLRVEPIEATAWLDIDGEAPGVAPCTIRVLPRPLQLLGALR